jgi:transmembrane sensor
MAPNDPELLALLDRYLAGECTGPEAERVREWLAADSQNHAVLGELERFRNIARNRPPSTSSDAAWRRAVDNLGLAELEKTYAIPLAGDRLPSRPHELPKRNPRRWAAPGILGGLAIAASALFILTTSRTAPHAPAGKSREFVTARGQRASIQLADGTDLTLGPASTVNVAADFGTTSRELTLVGEAHFNVQHDPAKPFRVHTKNGTAEDLGTEFVIDAYPQSNSTQVVVASGKVALAGTALTRGQLGKLDRSGLVSVTSNVDLDSYFSWTHGRLKFRDTPLSQAIERLGRWYDLDITIADPKAAKLPLTASFKDESIAQMLKVIDLTLNLRHDIHGRNVVFHKTRTGDTR